jgi:hypothetical protein
MRRVALIAFAFLSLAMRAVAFFRYRFDSDEPQHAHVAWAWTAGYVQYRDFFDNHAPLFHILTAPIVRLIGEREDVLLWLRVPMLPLLAIVLIATYVIAKRFYDRETALWATLLLSLFPPFFLKTIEYRTDNLWNTLWSVALLVLTAGALTPLRLFIVGLILGTALAVSLKTTLLVFTIATTGLATMLMCTHERPWKQIAKISAAFLIGFAIVPTALALWFVKAGAWPKLIYCVITFNEAVAKTRHNIWLSRALYPLVLAILLYPAWRRRGGREGDRQRLWRFFFGTATVMFIVTLFGFWILVSPRDLLPIMPIAAMVFVHAVRTKPPILVATALLFTLLTAKYAEWFRNGTLEDYTMLHQVIRLTRPGEPIMDLKGETVFRPRPFYYIFEYITRAEMRTGMIRDTVPESVIAANCHVAEADGDFFPPRAKAFLLANFIDVGRLRVSGQSIPKNGSFSIAVPGEYMIINKDGQSSGTLDGTPYRGARLLAAGPHHFDRVHPDEHVAVFWAPAFRRGYSPYHLQDRDF